ncbi:efflux RND transporter periplasmic adaptor subunit [Hamadaea tsunoensis]|uniref:efflux RND transporter periplasmic adaptor subunit n=1 Tax=Hamadaea tsunoensis TaxID=53368 RepID=UPI0003FB760D|nr:HlyD family efflux transporter periplasmic adaptor subunit [Hamadaea tsunoensis]
MRFLRRRTFLINGALGVLLVGGLVWAYLAVKGTGTTPAAASSTRTGTVAQGTVTETVTASGTVASANVMNHNFVTSGTVTSISVALGQKVTKGQVLAKVDDTDAAADLATAKENLSAAEDAYTRAKDAADGDTSADAVKQAQRTVNSAQNAVDSAQRAENGTVLKAGMAGTVTTLSGTVGGSSSGSSSSSGGTGSTGGGGTGSSSNSSSSSSSSSAFIVISDMAKLQVSASVPEADATRLQLKQGAQVTWNALANTSVEGTVSSISPTSTTSGGVTSYPIVVSLNTVPAGAKLGQSVSLSVVVAEAKDVLYVPAAAVKSAGNIKTVTVITDTGAQQIQPVTIGVEGDSYTEIKEGLTVGQKVVIATVTSTTGTTNFPGGGQFPGGGFGGAGTGGGGFGGNR